MNSNMSAGATIALKAAHLRKTCGAWSALRYCQRHNVSSGLYRLACQLLASHKFNQSSEVSCA